MPVLYANCQIDTSQWKVLLSLVLIAVLPLYKKWSCGHCQEIVGVFPFKLFLWECKHIVYEWKKSGEEWHRQWLAQLQWCTEGGFGVFKPPPKFRSFDKAEPNSQFHGKYIRNNLTRIRLSLIFWVVSWKALPASYDQHSGIFFLFKAWRDVSIKYQKLRKFYHKKWNFLYQITATSRTPD